MRHSQQRLARLLIISVRLVFDTCKLVVHSLQNARKYKCCTDTRKVFCVSIYRPNQTYECHESHEWIIKVCQLLGVDGGIDMAQDRRSEKMLPA